jgi:hypothetical protein
MVYGRKNKSRTIGTANWTLLEKRVAQTFLSVIEKKFESTDRNVCATFKTNFILRLPFRGGKLKFSTSGEE